MKARLLESGAASSEAAICRPQLTSLVDCMTILLVFLIRSFSAEGNLVTPARDLELPVSTSPTPARPSTSIELTTDALIADGTVLARPADLTSTDTFDIPGLAQWIEQRRRDGRLPEGDREVTIQSDRDVEFNIVKRVMYTFSKAGYSDFSVLVLNELN